MTAGEASAVAGRSDGLLGDAGTGAVLPLLLFSEGDCRDSSFGTLLRTIGLQEPCTLFFGRLGFSISEPGSQEPLELSYRHEDHLQKAIALTGLRLCQRDVARFADFKDLLEVALRNRTPVAVEIDHWAYDRSRFFRQRHLSHLIIIHGIIDPDRYAFTDCYLAYSGAGIVEASDLEAWCGGDPRGCGYVMYHLEPGGRVEFDDARHLEESWRETLRENVEHMLPADVSGASSHGVEAIRRVADELQAWMGEPARVQPSGGTSFPVRSFLEIGRNRIAHGRWLARAAVVAREPGLAAHGREFERIGHEWGAVEAAEEFYREMVRVDSSNRVDEFVLKLMSKLPRRVRGIADAEQNALQEIERLL